MLAATLAAGVALAMMTDAGRYARAAASILPTADDAARFIGFGIDQVSLTGQRFTFDGDVFDALDLANTRSLASFDAEAVKSRLERLPWVATADLTRVFPDRLEVRVTERKPFAVWARGDRHYLIDETGRVLSATASTERPDLPRVSGEGAATEARALMTLMDRYPDIARRLTEAERVAERRWTLRLDRGVTLHLPADREAALLQQIAAGGELGRLVAGDNCIIDLRVPERMTVRAASEGHPSGSAAAACM